MGRLSTLALTGVALALGFVLTVGAPDGAAWAGEGKKPAKKAKAEEHLDFQRSYGAALRQARIRNLPVFVSRHKDF